MKSRPLLPEWRYWPAVPFLSLILVIMLGARLHSPPPTPPQQHAAESETHTESWKVIGKLVAGFETMNAESWIAAFTGLTTGIFLLQLRAMWRTNQHYRVTERGYVKLSHEEPGIRWDTETGGKFKISIRIKNHGRTPAKVTDVISNLVVVPPQMLFDELPPSVRHNFAKETKAFLVADDTFYQHQGLSIDDAERILVDDGAQKLIVYGYVDYIDQFGVRYRGGYGRTYAPGLKNNLVFPDTGPFNYDRKRSRGEGVDWD